ncbi:MAG TPA: XRE family transcriptional regulator [Methylocystis sp.]|nr:XRE family transcriptional regulator [Methylocystis sp.]
MNTQAQSRPADALRPRRSPADQLSRTVAERLKRLIAGKARSFERLSELSGIDASELMRIESGAEIPKIGHLWRIANALGVPFGSLVASKERQGVFVIRKNEAQAIASADGAFLTRPLFPYDCRRPVEFYHVALGPSHIERAEAHAPGTKENLVVAKGQVEIIVGRESPAQLDEGDAIDFLADVPHSYRNLGTTTAILYLVMSYEAPAEGGCG